MKITIPIRNLRVAMNCLAIRLLASAALVVGSAQAVVEEDQAADFAPGTDGYQAEIVAPPSNLLAFPDTTLTLSGGAPANPPLQEGGTSTSYSTLVNGLFGTVPPPGGGGPGDVAIYNGWILTYTFAASHEIATVDVFTGWGDSGRIWQDYTVLYATEADPDNFIPLATVAYHPVGNSTWVRLTADSAITAKAIRFAFGNQQNGYVGFAELVVQESNPIPYAYMFSFGLPGNPATISGTNVLWIVPAGTDVTTLAPNFTLSSGAICSVNGSVIDSGDVADFTNPVHYLVTSSDGLVENDYLVTVIVAPPPPSEEDNAAQFDQGSDGYQSEIASQSVNLLAFPDTVLTLSGAAPANPIPDENTSGSWSTLVNGSFGTVPPSGGGGPGEVYIHNGYILTYTFADSHDLATIDAFSGWGDSGRIWQDYTVYYAPPTAPTTFIPLATVAYHPGGNSTWVRLTTVEPIAAKAIRFAFGDQQNGGVGYPELVVQESNPKPYAYMFSFGLPGNPATINETNVLLIVPFGTDVTTLAPEFTLSSGAICTVNGSVIDSGDIADFTNPVHYLVTSSDSLVKNDYLVTVIVTPPPPVEEDNAAQFAEGSDGYQSEIGPTELNLLADPGTVLTLSGAAPANPIPDENTSSSWSTLIDGSFGTVPPAGGGGPGEVYIHNNYVLTYTLAASHNITSIDAFSGWGDGGRIWQDYTIYYAPAAAPTTFIPLATVAYHPDGNSTWVHLTPVEPIAAKAIRFAFGNQQNGGVGYTELVVQGVSLTPLRITSTSYDASPNRLTLTWDSVPGATYTVESTQDVANPSSWSNLMTDIPSGGSSTSFEINAPIPGSFYRIKLQ